MKIIDEINSIGILGGGQLGMFLCLAAKRFKKKISVYSESRHCSAEKFCDNFFYGSFEDLNRIEKFCNSVDIVTVETENIPIKTLNLIDKKKKLRPIASSIEIAQNRIKEKKFLNSLKNIQTTPYYKIQNYDELKEVFNKFNKNIIIKSCTFGYDGKNQYRISSRNISNFKNLNIKNYIAEKVVDFKKEISVIISRDTKGEIQIYPPVENIHKKGILISSHFPSKLSKKIQKKAIDYAIHITKKLKIIGVLAIEMFVLENEEIYINELAPRPHNSGHWTLDCCNYNQFDNLILAISGLKIHNPEIFSGAIMKNILGNDYNNIKEISQKYKFYDYFKDSVKPKRKMGHFTELKKLI